MTQKTEHTGSAKLSSHCGKLILWLLVLTIFQTSPAKADKLYAGDRSYIGILMGNSAGIGNLDVSRIPNVGNNNNTRSYGLYYGRSWTQALDTEFRVMNLDNFPVGLNEFTTVALLPNGGETLLSDVWLTDVSAVYHFMQKNGSDRYTKRRNFSPFLRLGLSSVSDVPDEFGLFTQGSNYLSLGLGMDITSGGALGLRMEVLALHADYVNASIALSLRFN